MIQEAKKECYGSWYLPAGRMEPEETIVEALQREVKEEAGLHCEPLTLLCVEERGPSWIRFVFLAQPTGNSIAHHGGSVGKGQWIAFPLLVLSRSAPILAATSLASPGSSLRVRVKVPQWLFALPGLALLST